MVLGQVSRLVAVERIGPAMSDVAERAATRAFVAHDHEGRRSLAETFADVRARSLLADGDAACLAQDPLDLEEAAADGCRLDANPGGLARQIGGGTILIGIRAVLAAPFCLIVGSAGRDRQRGRWQSARSSTRLSFKRRGEAPHATVDSSRASRRPAIARPLVCDVGHGEAGVAAGIDPGERCEVHGHVQRQAVIAEPIADLEPDRGDLRARGDVDAGCAGPATASDADLARVAITASSSAQT